MGEFRWICRSATCSDAVTEDTRQLCTYRQGRDCKVCKSKEPEDTSPDWIRVNIPASPTNWVVPWMEMCCEHRFWDYMPHILDCLEVLEWKPDEYCAKPWENPAKLMNAEKNPETVNELRQHLTWACLLYTSPSPRDQRGSRMPSSA